MKKVIYFGSNVPEADDLITKYGWNKVPDTLFTKGEIENGHLILYSSEGTNYTKEPVTTDYIKANAPVALVIVRHGNVGEQDQAYVSDVMAFLNNVMPISGLWSSIIMVMCYGLRATVSDKPLVEIISEKSKLPVICFEGIARDCVMGNSLVITSSEGHVYTVRSEPTYNAIGSSLVL